ncbi:MULTISPECIES: hypothetical protein [Nitrospirillum]|uniref:Uncharacterized protein n=1 Tax=Nitrospirillum amazonense TaxID=28077 RepID=A0A560FAF1_9PROT|nr:hypothetical protein [Nitrospirillum amazonense]MEC4593013.1 hypothetical protein [Nitrospirillum amazonense]TWB18584.1 hypothetical protein FBZ88_12455 [Nitrospirillum amazonense]
MRLVLAAAVSIPLLLAAGPGGAGPVEPGFVPGVEDLPLMPGLMAPANAAVVFDQPEGRIVESAAQGDVSAAAITAFYAQTLPQLGWRPAGNDRWAREGERLEITATRDGMGSRAETVVHFILRPQ